MLKKELADKLAAGDYAVQTGIVDQLRIARQYARNFTKVELEEKLARREEKAAAEEEGNRAIAEAYQVRRDAVEAGQGGTLQLPVVRWPGESDQDLVENALDFYGADPWLVQGTVIPGMSENGHPVVCFTGDPEELERIHTAYRSEGVTLDPGSPIYGKDGALTNPGE